MRYPILAVIASMLPAAPVGAQERKDSDNERPPAVEWVYEANWKLRRAYRTHKGGFVTQENKIFKWDHEIGTVTTQDDKMTLVIKRDEFLQGRIVLKRDGEAWRGEMVDAKEKKWSIVVTEWKEPEEKKTEEKPKRQPEKKKEKQPEKKPEKKPK